MLGFARPPASASGEGALALGAVRAEVGARPPVPAVRTASITRSMVASMMSRLSSHSQTVIAVQPSSSSSARARLSRSTLRRNFASQNSTFLLGVLGLQLGQRCQ